MNTLEHFVFDGDGLGDAERVDSCRFILRTVKATAEQFETDIPPEDDEWPPDVAAAAEVLRGVASRHGRTERYVDRDGQRRDDRAGYAMTGLTDAAADDDWSAFVTFAPWAYDASVWNDRSRQTAVLNDGGTAVVVLLTPDEYTTIAAELGAARLIPKREWRRFRKERRTRGS